MLLRNICPWCGDDSGITLPTTDRKTVFCLACQLTTAAHDTIADAVLAWNDCRVYTPDHTVANGSIDWLDATHLRYTACGSKAVDEVLEDFIPLLHNRDMGFEAWNIMPIVFTTIHGHTSFKTSLENVHIFGPKRQRRATVSLFVHDRAATYLVKKASRRWPLNYHCPVVEKILPSV